MTTATVALPITIPTTPTVEADLTAAEAWAVNPIPRGVLIYLGLKIALIVTAILIAWIWVPHGVATWR